MNLRPLELTQIEEKLLQILIKYEELTAKQVVEQSEHNKKVIYENLEKLQRKGLVGVVIKNRTRHYAFSGTEAIERYFLEKEARLEEQKQEAQELIQSIEKIIPEKNEESYTELLVGKRSVKQFFLNMLEETKTYLCIGAPKESEDIFGETFWLNFHTRQREKGTRAKILFNRSLEYWPIHNANLQVRYMDIEPLTEILIYNDTVGIIVFSQDPSVTIIKNKKVADGYKDFFEIMWTQTEKKDLPLRQF